MIHFLCVHETLSDCWRALAALWLLGKLITNKVLDFQFFLWFLGCLGDLWGIVLGCFVGEPVEQVELQARVSPRVEDFMVLRGYSGVLEGELYSPTLHFPPWTAPTPWFSYPPPMALDLFPCVTL